MSWQLLIGLHILFTTAYSLSLRQLAQKFPDISRLATTLMYLLVIAPAGILYAFIFGEVSFNLSPLAWLFLVIAGLLFAGANFLAWKANTHLDAAQFAVIQNIQAIFTVIISAAFLGERLSPEQIVGAVILVITASTVSANGLSKKTFHISKWSWIAIVSSLLLGAAISNEKYLVGEMSLSTYFFIGWSLQTLCMALLTGKEWSNLPSLKADAYKGIIWQGLLRIGAGFTLVTALTLTESGVLASARSFKAVLIFVFALVILKEKNHLWRKIIGSVLAATGLWLLVS